MSLKKYFVPVAVASILTSLVILSSTISDSYAQQVECKPVKVIYARGSGQSIRVSEEMVKLQTKMENSLPEGLFSIYELGSETHSGYLYPAVNVHDLRNGNLIGAAVSGGLGNDYGRSVSSGVGELRAYLENTHSTCPGTVFVLGGYSQGAQVIGQALPGLSTEIRSKIVFSGLFGDPKLNLPEGRGFFPPACRGENLSPYRREIANCNVDQGSLGYRNPYLPSDLVTKTGLWCYPNDFVCGSSKNPLNTSGHGLYGGEGMAIDKAVSEAVSRLRTALPAHIASSIPPEDTATVDNNADVVYLIDTTGSMYSQIQSAKQFAADSASKVMAKNGRVALVAYRDQGDEYTAKIISGFSSDIAQFQAGLDTLEPWGGGDAPEALLHALMTAFNGLDWKYGVTKEAVVLTDIGYHDPDKVDGTTLADVVQRSLEIDPVNVYAVVPEHLKGDYAEITSRTSGQVIVDDGNTIEALDTALTKIQARPVVTLPLAEYKAAVGQSISFNASVTLPDNVTVTGYDWDLDGDGTFDHATNEPFLTHTYNSQFDGFMQMRANASNDTVGSISAKVQIGVAETETTPESPTNLVVQVTKTQDQKSTVLVSWSIPVTPPDHYVLTLNGIGIGMLTPERTSVEILDIDRAIENVIGIAGASADGTEGDMTSALLEKEQPPVTPPAPEHKKPLVFLLVKVVVKLITQIVQLFRF